MTDFRLGSFPSSSALYVYSLRSSIWFDPPYQRLGDIWPIDKRQLLIDSLINGYDIPKLYFHEFFPSKKVNGVEYRYAIVDGKQRLQSIFDFIEGRFPLGDSMEYLLDSEVDLSGLTYTELARQYPEIKTRLDGCVLPIVTIQTQELELIEDMFSRLNEAVPLNAAEKRNAFGGPLPPLIRQLANEKFFREKLPFSNRRYRHLELAAKFLFFENENGISDTKKVHLDEFVRKCQDKGVAAGLLAAAKKVTGQMEKTFVDGDYLLRSVGTVALYYHLFRELLREKKGSTPTRPLMERFEEARQKNRELAEKDVAKANFSLLEFDRLAQSPNDGVALKFRYGVMKKHIVKKR